MDVSAQLQTLNKEIEQLDKKIKELYPEKKSASEDDKAELLQRITDLKAEKEEEEKRREKLEDRLEGGGGGTQAYTLPH